MIHIKEGEEFCLGNTVYLFNGKSIVFVRKWEGEVKKSKPKSADFTPPTLKEVQDWFISKGYTKDHAKRAYDYYDAADWKDSRGSQVKNWKQKFIANWCKDEGKIQTILADAQTIDFFKK